MSWYLCFDGNLLSIHWILLLFKCTSEREKGMKKKTQMTRQLEKSIFQETWRIEPKNSLLLLSEAKSRICGVCFFFLSHFPFISPYFSQCKWDRNREERDELTYMKYAITIQRTLSFCIHFIYSAIVNIVIMNYFTLLLVSHLCGAPILFFHFGWFALRIASVTILLLRCYVWWIFFIAIFIFPYFVLSISLHFPFFVRSIHQAQIHAYPSTYCTHTNT